ncbi:MAG: bifunctional phosphoribosylaminoimidazolecarboxamide formyltransferase/IMP cyclohydrolase, partial [Alphaproteobacteria bacterium]|nr:bifunctional phosphoribosylaminoimidazolecarboxamide formyltransferase/IMP cyclohydrolase [Alphaproteobacteria bacterium]
MTIGRALLSVSDKTNLLPLARLLHQQGVQLVASGGTATSLEAASVPVASVADLTHFPEILGGRVKTLHPHIHGGLLARRDDPDHMNDLKQHDIAPIDLIIVNLYPFAAQKKQYDQGQLTAAQLIEHIDIGGVALIRAGAKNHGHVAVLTDPSQYTAVMAELTETPRRLTSATRQRLAAAAFAHTADYDQSIAAWFADHEQGANKTFAKTSPTTSTKPNPDQPPLTPLTPLTPDLPNLPVATPLRYGENPHQRAFFLTDRAMGLGHLKQWQGKDLSYNNYLDADSALRILINLAPLNHPAAVVIKHTD